MIECIMQGYLGTQTPYIYQKSCHHKPPKGYRPFYINHLGRHGARYLTNVDGLEQMINILEQAECTQQLTNRGSVLKEQIQVLLPSETENKWQLTKSGYVMERELARRMYQNYPEVFGKEVFAVSTYVERTKQSMQAFLEELNQWIPFCYLHAKSNGKEDPILRFFDINEAYLEYKKNGCWKNEISEYAKRENICPSVLKRLFKENFIKTHFKEETVAHEFISELYKVYTNQFDIVGKTTLQEIFTEEELQYLWENENARQYLSKGPSNVGQVLPTNIAFPLLMDFLNTSEEAVKYRNCSAHLRFAHAETIIPFSGLLRLLGFFNQTNAIGQIALLWQDSWVAPMAANLQWIFYEHPRKHDVLLKILYNESEVYLPIRSNYMPYYAYSQVRRFYLEQIRCMQLNWSDSLSIMLKKYNIKSKYC